MAIKSRLPELRARKGRISLRELSRQTGITAANLSKLDRSEVTRIDLQTMDKLCDFFHVEPGDLLERVPDQPPMDEETKRWLGADLSRLGELETTRPVPNVGKRVYWDAKQNAFMAED